MRRSSRRSLAAEQRGRSLLEEQRLKRYESAEEVAAACGIGLRTLRDAELGRPVSERTQFAIAKYYQCDVLDLFSVS